MRLCVSGTPPGNAPLKDGGVASHQKGLRGRRDRWGTNRNRHSFTTENLCPPDLLGIEPRSGSDVIRDAARQRGNHHQIPLLSRGGG